MTYRSIGVSSDKVTKVYLPTAQAVTIDRKWSTHFFSEAELNKLYRGETIEFSYVNKHGITSIARGRIEESEFHGNKFWGFTFINDIVPQVWCGHKFTTEEIEILSGGGSVYVADSVNDRGVPIPCDLRWGEENGRKKLIPDFLHCSQNYGSGRIS